MKNQTGSILLTIVIITLTLAAVTGSYYLGYQNKNTADNNQPDSLSAEDIKIPLPSVQTNENEVYVRIEAGDIVTTKNGTTKKITEWGFNSKPVLSPDKTKVAFLSETEETQQNKKKIQGFVPASKNVWIIDTDGANPIKVTNHKDNVLRDNLIWLTNNKILFTDGVSSVKTYDISERVLKNVLGPENPEPYCIDACGGGSQFSLSPDHKYLVLLGFNGSGGGIINPPGSAILNTETLGITTINQKFTGISSSATFKEDSLFLSGSIDDAYTQKNITINLTTGQAFSL
jgi:Tol biopolymer transport system component